MFKVKTKKGVVGRACLPASLFRRGFRVLPLYNKMMYHDNYSFIALKISKRKETISYQI